MLEGIPGTSLWGLKARAEEDRRPDGLFQDPLAERWLQRLEPFFSEALSRWYNPLLQKSIALRTDIFDRTVQRFLDTHDQPVIVELGAGFSTRFARLNPAKGDWYELDLPEVMELRMSLKEPAAEHHWYLADSMFAEDWLEALTDHAPEQMLFLAEGLLMYFPLPRIQWLFQMLKQHFPGALMAFDVMGERNLKAAQVPGDEVSAPMYWGLPDREAVPAFFHLAFLEDLSLAAQFRYHPAYKRYLSWLQRLLLSQNWLTRQMGGTVLARL